MQRAKSGLREDKIAQTQTFQVENSGLLNDSPRTKKMQLARFLFVHIGHNMTVLKNAFKGYLVTFR